MWYCDSHVGHHLLTDMISKLANLSRRYTNHSVRATSITALDDAGVKARHIIRISGHKSETSVKSYSSRLNENRKREFSQHLSKTIIQENAPASSSNTGSNVLIGRPLINLCDNQNSMEGCSNVEFHDSIPSISTHTSMRRAVFERKNQPFVFNIF